MRRGARPGGAPGGGPGGANNTDYTEFGIKIHKLRLTLKVQRRASSCSNGSGIRQQQQQQLNSSGGINVDPGHTDRHGRIRLGSEERSRAARARTQQQQQHRQPRPRPRPRPVSSSSLADDQSLRNLDLDSNAGSRRPVVRGSPAGRDSPDGAAASTTRGGAGTRVSNWEFQVNNKINMFFRTEMLINFFSFIFFQGFYSPPIRTSTPSSGYSSAAVSRTSSFSSDFFGITNSSGVNNSNNVSLNPNGSSSGRVRHPAGTGGRLRSNSSNTDGEDSAYSEVYSTIEELSELADPFDEEEDEEEEDHDKAATIRARHSFKNKNKKKHNSAEDKKSSPRSRREASKSMSSLLHDSGCVTLRPDEKHPNNISHHKKTRSSASILEDVSSRHCPPPPLPPRCQAVHQSSSSASSLLTLVASTSTASDIPPPLPPRSSKCRPPARPPYPSAIVRKVQEITQPLVR